MKFSDRIAICAYNIILFNDIAHSTAFDLVAYIKKLPIFRHEVKKITKQLEKQLKQYTKFTGELSSVSSPAFYADVCDNISDIVFNDVKKLEFSIKSLLDKHKVEDSMLIAKIETARCMTLGACINLDMREKDIRKELPVNLSDMRITHIANSIDRLSSILNKNYVDFSQNQEILNAYRIIQRKLLNVKNIAYAINEASANT